MNTAKYVDEQIAVLKTSGIPLTDAAWQAALLCVGWPYIFGDRGAYCTPSHRQAVYNKGPDKKEYAAVKKSCPALNGGSCSGCKWHPNGSNVRAYDCRGFTYWIILQIYGFKIMGAGATSQWNTESNWEAKGLVADGVPEDTLVCLFYPEKGNPKVMAHTGLGYHGETVECGPGVKYCKTRDKKWTHWAVPACVGGDVPTPTPPTPTPTPDPKKRPTLRKGSTGEYVVECQSDLIELGYDLSPYGADGKYGNKTMAAVKTFQGDFNKAHPDQAKLAVDGITGPMTWAALDQAIEEKRKDPDPEPTPVTKTYTVIVSGLEKAQAESLAASYPGQSEIREEG